MQNNVKATQIKNKENFLRHLKKIGINENEETIFRWLEIIPGVSKKVIVLRWGLDGSEYCSKFEELNLKMKQKNSREIYKQAEVNLKLAKYVEMIIDNSTYDYIIAANLGKLLVRIMNNKYCYCIQGEDLLNIIFYNLKPYEYQVICMKFGLGESIKTYEEIANKMKLTVNKVDKIEKTAINKIRNCIIYSN